MSVSKRRSPKTPLPKTRLKPAWDRRLTEKKERPNHFALYLKYRDMGWNDDDEFVGRSLKPLISDYIQENHFDKKDDEVFYAAQKTMIESWFLKYNWESRASDYDQQKWIVINNKKNAQKIREAEERYQKDIEISNQEAALWAERKRQLAEKEWELAQRMLKRAEQILDLPVVKKVVQGAKGETIIINPIPGLRIRDAASLIVAGLQIARECTNNSSGVDIIDAFKVLGENNILPHELGEKIAILFEQVPDEARKAVQELFQKGNQTLKNMEEDEDEQQSA